MQRQHDRPAKDAFTHDAEMYMHLVRRLCHRTCTTHSGYTLVAIVESFALYLLGGRFLLFTRFDPFLCIASPKFFPGGFSTHSLFPFPAFSHQP